MIGYSKGDERSYEIPWKEHMYTYSPLKDANCSFSSTHSRVDFVHEY